MSGQTNRPASPEPQTGRENGRVAALTRIFCVVRSERVELMAQQGMLEPTPSGSPAVVRGSLSGRRKASLLSRKGR